MARRRRPRRSWCPHKAPACRPEHSCRSTPASRRGVRSLLREPRRSTPLRRVPPGSRAGCPSQPQSANPAQTSNVTPTKSNSATATDSASDPELSPVTGGLLPGAVDRSGPSLSVPPPAVNTAIAGRGNLAVPPPAPILPPGSLRSSAPTPGLLRAGIAGMAAGNLGQEHVGAVRNVDPNIQPTAAQATRSGQGRLFTRSQSSKPEPSTSKPVTNASPQPTPRRSLLSRVLGGDR